MRNSTVSESVVGPKPTAVDKESDLLKAVIVCLATLKREGS